jgi:hypothetical protein
MVVGAAAASDRHSVMRLNAPLDVETDTWDATGIITAQAANIVDDRAITARGPDAAE